MCGNMFEVRDFRPFQNIRLGSSPGKYDKV